nr:MAG TPA: hypothetical protein [Caudoviricetes sp.]DAX62131.1 MAG TPA: hypothetical protein [Caudoviricetes sp.]
MLNLEENAILSLSDLGTQGKCRVTDLCFLSVMMIMDLVID